ncbi:hypothetical protein H072_4444 [Dactylellina haptotyla CBS 200.50]|uniref:Uncharacterized protein n=1 Tax=Dactylellina haptotyla (strain CBS 200.50) TaxID=1284197 RepID=S8AFH7_DACHA|nr:hypothetical protein H072_4444 [Dactylellina haptotyla CBS 200.50]
MLLQNMLFNLLPVALFHVALATADLVRVGNLECEDIRQYHQCLPRGLASAPGIGIYLSAEYGTVSASYHDGNVTDIARIDASPELTKLMLELADPFTCSKAFSTTQKILHTLRNPSKWTSLLPFSSSSTPTSPAAILAETLSALRMAASEALRTPISQAVVILPDLPGLQYPDLEAAASLAGLTLLQGFTASSAHAPLTYSALAQRKAILPTLTTAAYAAAVPAGLCRNYTSFDECNEENLVQETEEGYTRGILRISLNAQTLSIDGAECASATMCFGDLRSRNFEGMGYHSPLRKEDPTKYWDVMTDLILRAGIATGRSGLDTLLLTGDYVLEEDFLDNLEMALLYVDGGADVIDQWHLDGSIVSYPPVYLPARGAAEMAKRIAAGQMVYAGEEGCTGSEEAHGDAKLEVEGVTEQPTT